MLARENRCEVVVAVEIEAFDLGDFGDLAA
jgi:hypothetical protein